MEEEAKDWSWRDTSEMMGQGGAWVIGGRGAGVGGGFICRSVWRGRVENCQQSAASLGAPQIGRGLGECWRRFHVALRLTRLISR